MRTFFKAIFFTIALSGLYAIFSGVFSTPCDKTFHYKIGALDSRFHLSESDAKKEIQNAENIWEDLAHKNLFVYDPNARFTINFVFDERQESVLKIKESNEQIDSGMAQYKRLEDQYTYLAGVYEKRVAEYNAKVEQWNERGGAPPGKYYELTSEAQELEALRTRVNDLASAVNRSASNLEGTVALRNAVAQGAGEFEGGVYTGDHIDVYEFYDENDLVALVTHELGHALSLNHVEDSSAIMYRIQEVGSSSYPKLSQADIGALEKECKTTFE